VQETNNQSRELSKLFCGDSLEYRAPAPKRRALMAKAVTPKDQRALVDRLMSACGGAYSPQRRRKYFISGPQWAAAYQGQALFHAPTREAIGFERVIEEYANIGIGYWTTHDTDVIPTAALGKEEQAAIVSRIQGS